MDPAAPRPSIGNGVRFSRGGACDTERATLYYAEHWEALRTKREAKRRAAGVPRRGFEGPGGTCTTMARKASTAARGYGSAHRALRERLRSLVEAGLARCVRCGELIEPGDFWDVGHVDETERTVVSGPEHRRCNRTTARHRLRKVSRQRVEPQPRYVLPERLRKGGDGLRGHGASRTQRTDHHANAVKKLAGRPR
jgi:hypothetical protein